MVQALTDRIDVEIRFKEDESRQSPGILTGTLMTYETRASDRPETFEQDSLEWADDGIVIYEQHNPHAPIVRAIPFVEGREVKINTPFPNTTRGRDAAVNLREGVLKGLSVEFKAVRQSFRSGVRSISKAMLRGAGLVVEPAYTDSLAEVRSGGDMGDSESAILRAFTWL